MNIGHSLNIVQAEQRFGRLLHVEFVEMSISAGIEMTYDDYDKMFQLAECAKDGRIAFEDFICTFLRGTRGGGEYTRSLKTIF